ncbi:MAG TPA: iron-sulfur cluster assembly scaffold protein [Methanothrix sp.]|nr:iron-sulfur cluster assembly scaffold protein [Methanothrix sp.]HPR67597.1 iron-sulfur cluster assembly scaffold protein [Methanothrix sp.]
MANLGYTEKVLDHFKNPRNPGRIEDADVTAKVGSAACGDMVQLYMKVDPDTEVIEDIKFESFGCAANIASTSVTTELAKGKTLEEAKGVHFKDVVEELGGLPKHKVHCAQLATSGLKAAIMKYEAKMGRRAVDEDFVKRMMTGVLDPAKGLNIVAAKRVDLIEVDGKKVRVVLSKELDPETRATMAEDVAGALSGLDLEVSVE